MPVPGKLCLAVAAIAGIALTSCGTAPTAGVQSEQSGATAQAGAGTGCFVTQDSGLYYNDLSVSDCTDFYLPQHDCAIGGLAIRPPVCETHDMFKAVEWGQTDMIINTHRGVWALTLSRDAALNQNRGNWKMSVGGPAENSFGGVVAADTAGFRSVEYDIILMRRDTDALSDATPIINHFTDLRGFTSWPLEQIITPETAKDAFGFVFTNAWKDVPQGTVLRDRNGDVMTPGFDNQLVTVRQFLETVKSRFPKTVVVFDPKWARALKQIQQTGTGIKSACIGFCDVFKDSPAPEILELIYLTAQEAKAVNMLPYIVFKVPQMDGLEPATIKDKLGQLFGQVLWAPQPALSPGVNPTVEQREKVLKYIDSWCSVYRNERKFCDVSNTVISFWDTSIYSVNSWMAQPFAWDGQQYADLMDFLQQRSGKRASIWVPDPAGPGGRHGNYAMTWTQYGNDNADVRGDAIYNLVYSKSRNTIISSDRPDLFVRVRNWLIQTFPGTEGAAQ